MEFLKLFTTKIFVHMLSMCHKFRVYWLNVIDLDCFMSLCICQEKRLLYEQNIK